MKSNVMLHLYKSTEVSLNEGWERDQLFQAKTLSYGLSAQ